MASGLWTDERATRVATFAVVLACMSLLCGPIYGGAMIESLHRSLGLALGVSRWVSLPLAALAGVPAYVLASVATSRARSDPFPGTRRARAARRIAMVASAISLFASLASASIA